MAQLLFLCFVVFWMVQKCTLTSNHQTWGKKSYLDHLQLCRSYPLHPFSTQALSVHCAWHAIDAMEQLSRSWEKLTTHPIQSTEICYCKILPNVVKWYEVLSNISNQSIHSSQIGGYKHSSPSHGKRWSPAMQQNTSTSLNLRALPQNHLDRPWPATSWSYSVSSCGLKGEWLVGAGFLWPTMILARRQKAKIYIMSHHITSTP